MLLKPDLFFNLKAFEHRGLWGADDPVWAAIKNLPYYLGAMLAHGWTDPYRGMNDLDGLDPTVRIQRPDLVRIARTAVIKPFTVIEGSAVIDDGAIVGPHAYLRDAVIVGRNARVGHGTEVKRSVLFPGAKAPHRNSILDSVLGHEVNVGGHIVTPNKRSDGRTVPVRVHGASGQIDSGLMKLGIIAGDGCFFGCAVRFNPGMAFPPKTRLP